MRNILHCENRLKNKKAEIDVLQLPLRKRKEQIFALNNEEPLYICELCKKYDLPCF